MVNAKFPEGMMVKHYKFKMYPTEEQKKSIDRCIELRRFIYNWALELQLDHYERYNVELEDRAYYSKRELERMYDDLRHNPEYSFVQDIPYIAGRLALWDLCNAFDRYHKHLTNRPRFKSKKRSIQSYRIRNDRLFFDGTKIKLEALSPIEIKYDFGYSKHEMPKVYNPVISRDSLGEYWISFGLLTETYSDFFTNNKIPPLNRAIGIDLNVKKRFVLSTGDVFYAPDVSKLEKRIRKWQSITSKDRYKLEKLERTNPEISVSPSKRSLKRKTRYHKLLKKHYNISENFIQTTTKRIVEMNPSAVVMEHINIKGFMHNIAQYTFHAKFYRIREVMQKKCSNYEIPFIVADPNYKSSQICSNCGHVKNIYSKKTYICPVCKTRIDRDLNAALNLEHLAYKDFEYSFQSVA